MSSANRQQGGLDISEIRKEFLAFSHQIWDESDARLGDSIWHYTSFEAFEGIIKSGVFWLSDMKTLNDPSEFIYLDRVIRPIFARKSVPDEIKARILRLQNESFGIEWFGYVMSFCRTADRLDQWHRYADESRGVALSFDYRELIDRALQFNYSLVEVIYDEKAQGRQTERLIDFSIQLGRRLGIRKRDQLKFWFEATLQLFQHAFRSKHRPSTASMKFVS